MRRNSGEPSPDLCAEYTQDGEPRQPRVANSSAQAMENPAENGGILLADSMRPQLNTFYLAMKTYRIRLPTHRMLNFHPIF